MLPSAFLIACAVSAVPQYQQIPQFYTTNDCTGRIDAESKSWSMRAGVNGRVTPFAEEGSWLPLWALNECMTEEVEGVTYSVKLAIDETACANGEGANQLVFLNYSGTSACNIANPTVTQLTLDQCVRYERGSVKLTPKLNVTDLCVVTNYVTKMTAGGVEQNVWNGKYCLGAPDTVSRREQIEKDCVLEPDCVGCCQQWDSSCGVEDFYTYTRAACETYGDTWKYGFKHSQYTDSTCLTEEPLSKLINGVFVQTDGCNAVTQHGEAKATSLVFVDPMTVKDMCEFVNVSIRYNLSDEFVTPWAELNAGGAAVPHLVALALLVAAVLM